VLVNGEIRTDFFSQAVKQSTAMRTRWIVFLSVGVSLFGLTVMAYGGLVTYAILTSHLAPEVQGCPSHAVPLRPGSRLHDHAQITLGSDRGGMTTGCWATYGVPASSSAEDVYDFYAEPKNVPGWNLDESYLNTGYLAFRSTAVPGLRADVGVTTMKQYFAFGPSEVTYAISVCLCDPRSMAQ